MNGKFPPAERIAIGFRGYNITNMGKTHELLQHPLLKDRLRERLDQASCICGEVLELKIDWYDLIQKQTPSSLMTYAEELAMIVAVELAHWDALLELLGPAGKSKIRLVHGYSLGEVTAMIVGGLLTYEEALRPILSLAQDAAAIAPNITLGILFSRGPSVNTELIRELCEEITCRGDGVIAISTYLSPNTVLLMGEGPTINHFKELMPEHFPRSVHLRKNDHYWPPLHTPIVLQKFLRDRAAVILQTTPCRTVLPEFPILSCVTGDIAYNGYNTRTLMTDWVDHPQLLWDCVDAMMKSGINQVFHLGPEPNILPATLTRLAENVQMQLKQPSWYSYGLRTISRLARDRSWLVNLLSRDAALLRAPHVQQIIFEDWLQQHPEG